MDSEKKIPVVEIATGEVFLKDKIVNNDHCYVCNKEVNKFDTNDTVLLRVGKEKMGFCCCSHEGIVKEFIEQFKRLPYGWSIHDKNIKDINIDVNVKSIVNKHSKRPRKNKKTAKGNG